MGSDVVARGQCIAALLGARTAAGHWDGELSSSALSTATAVAALALHAREIGRQNPDALTRDALLIAGGIQWLLAHQNRDGGWGDTDRSVSNISTTALVWAALAFAAPS